MPQKRSRKPAAKRAASETFPLRRGEPGAQYGYTLPDGSAREIKADADGVVKPERAEDVAILDTFGLDVVSVTASGVRTLERRNELGFFEKVSARAESAPTPKVKPTSKARPAVPALPAPATDSGTSEPASADKSED